MAPKLETEQDGCNACRVSMWSDNLTGRVETFRAATPALTLSTARGRLWGLRQKVRHQTPTSVTPLVRVEPKAVHILTDDKSVTKCPTLKFRCTMPYRTLSAPGKICHFHGVRRRVHRAPFDGKTYIPALCNVHKHSDPKGDYTMELPQGLSGRLLCGRPPVSEKIKTT